MRKAGRLTNPDDDKTQTHVVLTKGTMVSHYCIAEKIGAGGMGEVYLAEDTKLNRKVALKFLPSHLCQAEDCRARFKREAQAAAKLSHPNIIHIYEVSEFQGRPFFAMEHIEGRSLRDAKTEEFDIDRIVGFAIQLCDGLQTAHTAGITHRDIKPSNIVIDSSGRPKLLDFGLATVKGGEHLTKTGSTLGTIGYMSPEQIEGKATDARSDLFSLGVVLYELIANKSPFRRDDETATLKAILQDTPEPLARYKSDVPDDLQRIITKLLEKDPTLRYQSAAGVIPDLKKLSATSTTSVAIERRRSLWSWYVIPSAAVILLAVVAIWYFGYRDKELATTGTDDRIMLAVLPFENIGGSGNEYFVDGLTDEIAAKLSLIPNLRVIGRRSVREYRKSAKSTEEIGAELGVDFILDGTVRWQNAGESDHRMRVTPQLIEVSDASLVWTDVYEDRLDEIFSVQGKIATRVAGALNIALVKSEQSALEVALTENLEAYDYHLRAQDYFLNFAEREDLERAIQLFQRAVELDSTFMKAWVDLSFAASFYHWAGYDSEFEMAQLAGKAARIGAELDTDDAYSHLALGYYAYYCEEDYQKALDEFICLSQRQPSIADAKAAAGYVLRRLGRWDESLALQLQAVEIEPLVGWYYDGIVGTAQLMRKFDVAEQWLTRGLALFPDMFLIQGERTWLLLATSGDPSAVLAVIDTISNTIPNQAVISGIEMEMAYWAGDFDRALKAAQGLYDYAETPTDSASYFFRMGSIYDKIGDSLLSRTYFDSAGSTITTALQESSPYHQGGTYPVGQVFTKLYGPDEAIRAAKEYAQLVPLSRDALFGAEMLNELAQGYVWAGELDSAIAIIDTLLSVPSRLTVPMLMADPDLAPLRNHPRFQALIEKYEKEHGT